jgi:hypothetical protein
LDSNDFRAARYVLDPHDFALSDDGPEPPPSDLIDEKTWHGIMMLPGDVAIRTTNQSRLAKLDKLESSWTEMFPEPGIVASAMLDCFDGFQAATFNMVHGFYKEALSALRNAVETMTLATVCVLASDGPTWSSWENGAEIRFKLLCDRLKSLGRFRTLEERVRKTAGTNILAGDNGSGRNAWARSLYQRPSHFSHARGDASNAEIWESNGPIFSAHGFRTAFQTYLEVHAICVIFVKTTVPTLSLPPETKNALRDCNTQNYIDHPFHQVCQLYLSELF